MFPSLSSRVAALGTVVIVALLVLVASLADASVQTRESFRWVTHSGQVIEALETALINLREAESGQRGFLLTHNPQFVRSFEQRVAAAQRALTQVDALTADNDVQNGRARELKQLMAERIQVLRTPLDLGRHGDFAQAEAYIATGKGRDLMIALTARATALLEEEHALQAGRIKAADDRLTHVKELALIGGPVIALMVLSVCIVLIRNIRRPVGLIEDAMAALGTGDRNRRIEDEMGSEEFAHLAKGYNAMADRLEFAVSDQVRSERELKVAHAELMQSSETLREHGDVIALLGGMAHRMQAARTDDELAQVIRVFVPRVLPGSGGMLFAHNNSRNLLVPIAGWGGQEAAEMDGFAPDQCWALRRGQPHFLTEPGSDIVCAHVHDTEASYHCEPLLAGGEVIGTLYLDGVVSEDASFRLSIMAENIASALVNQRLQRGLREQTIRDPLTGLFNRRYMEETLALEIARASRSGAPLSVVMCDVDHFKRFNDEFGHDAGDAVLQAVAAEMQRLFRDGDVVCRYGGEEFTIIVPGCSAETVAERVERVRQGITELNIKRSGSTLGATSMSFGVARWDESMARDGSTLVQAADAALYRAKREGRNRAVFDYLKAA
ncbi:diguanylate cyclase [Sphingomonas sp. AP4-R1]|uniref:diguanylate cyclase n=1 Tax=Sphingomonas sp. AP4-R1 TaxID=2735134 RepID=UPI001493448D|nr:diguanylate cyclase [Sphingomonas sp. AP4-R1]